MVELLDVNQILINIVKTKIKNGEINDKDLSKNSLENWIDRYIYDVYKTLEYSIEVEENSGDELIIDLIYFGIEKIDIKYVVVNVLEDLKEN